MQLLTAFLRESAMLPFVWGSRDCALWACAWIERARGFHPALELVGGYDTAMQCARLLKARGGLPQLAGEIAERAGMAEVMRPAMGDIVCVQASPRSFLGAALGICAGERLALKAPQGVLLTRAPLLAAWRL